MHLYLYLLLYSYIHIFIHSSQILFFGVEFTKSYSTRYSQEIIPSKYAILVEDPRDEELDVKKVLREKIGKSLKKNSR